MDIGQWPFKSMDIYWYWFTPLGRTKGPLVKQGAIVPTRSHSEPFLVAWRAGVLGYVHYHRVWFWATSRGIEWISVAAALMLRYQRKTNIVKDRQEKRQSCFNWVCCVRPTLLKTRYQKSYRSLSFITFAHCHVT